MALLLTVMLDRPWLEDYQIQEGESDATVWIFWFGFVGGATLGAVFGLITGCALAASMLLTPADEPHVLRVIRAFAGFVFAIAAVAFCWWMIVVVGGDPLLAVIPIAGWAIVVYASRLVATGATSKLPPQAGN
jgi:hypothetical protein